MLRATTHEQRHKDEDIPPPEMQSDAPVHFSRVRRTVVPGIYRPQNADSTAAPGAEKSSVPLAVVESDNLEDEIPLSGAANLQPLFSLSSATHREEFSCMPMGIRLRVFRCLARGQSQTW